MLKRLFFEMKLKGKPVYMIAVTDSEEELTFYAKANDNFCGATFQPILAMEDLSKVTDYIPCVFEQDEPISFEDIEHHILKIKSYEPFIDDVIDSDWFYDADNDQLYVPLEGSYQGTPDEDVEKLLQEAKRYKVTNTEKLLSIIEEKAGIKLEYVPQILKRYNYDTGKFYIVQQS